MQKIKEFKASYENCNRLGPGAIEEIQQMNSNQLEGLVSFFELLNKYDVDEPYYDKTTNH